MTRIRPDNLIGELRHRHGDLPPPGSARWGKVARLASGTAINPKFQGGRQDTLDFVQTGIIADSPIPIALRFRFSTDGQTYTPNVPGTFGGDVVITLTEVVDMKSGGVVEKIRLTPGDAMPICAVLARSLNVSVFLDAEDTSIFVQVTAAPTTMIDCEDLVGPPSTKPAAYSHTDLFRYAAVTANTYELVANAKRATVTIVNQSAVNLFVSMHQSITITPGSEAASVILPGGSFSGTSWDNYQGQVFLKFDGDDSDGYALLTEGIYP